MNYSELFFLLLKCAALLLFFVATLKWVSRGQKNNADAHSKRINQNELYFTPAPPRLNVRFQSARNLRFQWRDVAGASHYQLLERVDHQAVFKLVGSYILPGRESLVWTVPLHNRINAQYILRAYSEDGFADSASVSITTELEDNLRYLRSSEIDASEFFGFAIDLSDGGDTLIIAEDDFSSAYPRVQGKTAATYRGAAYVFNRAGSGQWNQTAYISALAKADLVDDNCDQPPPQSATNSSVESTPTETSHAKRFGAAPEGFARQLGWKS